jgi:hypothetical protein
LFSSSFAWLNLCGAFLIVFKTFLTLGFIALSERRPLPPVSVIVGKAELLFLLNDPKRSERDNERDNGRSRCKVELCEELGDDDDVSVAFLSSSVVTNLSSRAKSASLLEVRFAALLPVAWLLDGDVGIGSTSESCNNKEWNSSVSINHHYQIVFHFQQQHVSE